MSNAKEIIFLQRKESNLESLQVKIQDIIYYSTEEVPRKMTHSQEEREKKYTMPEILKCCKWQSTFEGNQGNHACLQEISKEEKDPGGWRVY